MKRLSKILFFLLLLPAVLFSADIEIATLNELQAINESLSGNNFTLMNDIDASATSGWNEGAGFVPLGNSSTKFNSNFDGDGHVISNLTINRPSEIGIGLFGYAGQTNGNGNISNLGVENATINGLRYVGVLIGILQSYGSVDQCYATGAVTVIAAAAADGSVGGLIGNSSLNIDDSYAIVDIDYTKSAYGGGSIGGFVGNVNSGTITNCYAAGTVTSNGSQTGGFLGNSSAGTFIKNYWDKTVGWATGEKATGKTTAEMKTLSTFPPIPATHEGVVNVALPVLGSYSGTCNVALDEEIYWDWVVTRTGGDSFDWSMQSITIDGSLYTVYQYIDADTLITDCQSTKTGVNWSSTTYGEEYETVWVSGDKFNVEWSEVAVTIDGSPYTVWWVNTDEIMTTTCQTPKTGVAYSAGAEPGWDIVDEESWTDEVWLMDDGNEYPQLGLFYTAPAPPSEYKKPVQIIIFN